MRGWLIAATLSLLVLASSCGDSSSSGPASGSPDFIGALATMDRSVEDIDVCDAIRDAGAEDDLADILGADSVGLEGRYSEAEDGLAQVCEVTANDRDDSNLAVAFMQGTEFKRAAAGDPVVFAGCRVMQKPPPGDHVRSTAVRATCGRALTVDISPDARSTIPPWTSESVSKPSSEYVDVLHDVLVAVSSQG
jgi:hypothetical protein